MKNKNLIKEICAVILLVLITSNITPAINNDMISDEKLPNTVSGGASQTLLVPSMYEIIVQEGFEEGAMPPTGWSHYQYNPTKTWEINTSNPHGGTYYASCEYDPNLVLQDEWIVTPTLNFSAFSEVYLSFWWFMSYYWGVSPYDNYDLNVYITTNNEVNWTLIWNEDTIGNFDTWEWYDTTLDEHLDISDYAEEPAVKIGFVYYGLDGALMGLDDIFIYGTLKDVVDPIEVFTNGPYEAYCCEDIYFQGSATGGTPPYTTWEWDFGDGNTSNEQNPVHDYLLTGLYDVVLTVYDSNNSFAWNSTMANITDEPKVPVLLIGEIKGPFGVSATFTNKGGQNATDVEWEIEFIGGVFGQVKKTFSGNFSELAVDETKTVRSRYFIGFGSIDFKISLDASNAARVSKDRSAFKIGPLILNIHNLV